MPECYATSTHTLPSAEEEGRGAEYFPESRAEATLDIWVGKIGNTNGNISISSSGGSNSGSNSGSTSGGSSSNGRRQTRETERSGYRPTDYKTGAGIERIGDGRRTEEVGRGNMRE